MSIPDQQASQSFAPHEAATLTGVSVHSIRRWCEYHAAFLSPRANPESGVQRRLTPRDVEVMKHIKYLRNDGLSVNLINEKLAGLTFAEIDATPSTDAQVLAYQDSPSAPDSTPAMLMPQEYLATIERRFEALEQAKVNDRRLVRDGVFMFMAGGVTVLLIVLIVIVIVDLWTK